MPISEYHGQVQEWLAKYEQAWNDRLDRIDAVTPKRHGSAHIEFPNDLEMVLTREFDARIQHVFGILTKPDRRDVAVRRVAGCGGRRVGGTARS